MLSSNEYKNRVLLGDCLERLKELPDGIVDMCITSPPYYGLRDYGVDGQIGLEENPEEYIDKLVEVFREVGRVLRNDGTLLVNIGDSYWGSGSRGFDFTGKLKKDISRCQGSDLKYDLSRVPKCKGNEGVYKDKDLIGIPWLLAFALRKDGWYLRQDIIWHKPNPMPESVKDRCTKSHEYVFLLSKQPHYYFDNQAIKEPTKEISLKRAEYGLHTNYPEGLNGHIDTEKMGTRFSPTEANKRDVWSIPPANVKEAHFATMPEKLAETCIKAGSRKGGIVLDQFFGSGTTGRVAIALDRMYIGCELNPEYIEISNRRTDNVQMRLF